jgi:hypothetical protein
MNSLVGGLPMNSITLIPPNDVALDAAFLPEPPTCRLLKRKLIESFAAN